MSTRSDLNTYDEKYFDKLFPLAYPRAPKEVKDWIKKNMLQQGDVAVESLLETAIAKTNKITKASSAGYDFINPDGTPGGDAKKATAFLNPHRPRREAVVTNFHAKIGDLYVCIYEPYLDRFYFFCIPNRVYKKRKILSFYFELDGTPRRKNMRIGSYKHLWNYEVKEIKHLYEGTK